MVQVRVAEDYPLDVLRRDVHREPWDLRGHGPVVKQDLAVFVRHEKSGAADLPGGSQNLHFQTITKTLEARELFSLYKLFVGKTPNTGAGRGATELNNWRRFLAVVLILIMTSAPFAAGVSAGTTSPSPKVSYNPGKAAAFHAPLSQMGLIGFNQAPRPATVPTPPRTPSGSGPAGVPSGLTRFIDDASYMPQSETTLAVDPSSTDRVVGGFNDARFFLCPDLNSADCPDGYTKSVSGFSVSVDGGASVQKSGDIPGVDVTLPNSTSRFLLSWGDPILAAMPGGPVYYSSLALDPVNGVSGIMIAQSNDQLWSPSSQCQTLSSVPTSNPCWSSKLVYSNLTFPCTPFSCSANTLEDKDTMALDMNPSSAFFGDVYIAWDHFYGDGTSALFAARCTSNLACTMISGDTAPVISGSDRFAGYSTVVVAPDGSVKLAWCNFGTNTSFGPVACKVRSSPAGGTSFGPIHPITSFMGGGTDLPADLVIQGFATEQFRASSIITIATDTSGQPGNLYFAVALCVSGTYDVIQGLPGAPTDNPGNCGKSAVFFSRSTDGGASWSAAGQISQSAVVIQPTVAVDSSTGTVVVAYYSSQFDPFNHRLDVVAAVSNDHGVTFSELRMTKVSNEPNAEPSGFDYSTNLGGSFVAPQYGDYMTAVAADGRILVLFTGNYAEVLGTLQADPFLAKSAEVGTTFSLGTGSVGAAPGSSLAYSASGFTPGSTLQVALDWSGTKVVLTSAVVPASGSVSWNFTVPNVQSQVYTAVASDADGLSASATLAVGQASISPIQGALNSIQSKVDGLGTEMQSRFSSLESSLADTRSAFDQATTSLSDRISQVNATIASANSDLMFAVSSLSNRVVSSLSGPSSTLSVIEYLVFLLIILVMAVAFLMIRKERARPAALAPSPPAPGPSTPATPP